MNQEFENIKSISRTETFLWERKTKFGEIYQNQLMCISQVVKWEKQKRYKYVFSGWVAWSEVLKKQKDRQRRMRFPFILAPEFLVI